MSHERQFCLDAADSQKQAFKKYLLSLFSPLRIAKILLKILEIIISGVVRILGIFESQGNL